MKHLPEGVHLVETGDTEFMKELYQNFALAVGAGVLMVFAVLVLLFVACSIPLPSCRRCRCPSGRGIALLLTGQPFSMPAFIGIMMLMGIAAKNRSCWSITRSKKCAPGKTGTPP